MFKKMYKTSYKQARKRSSRSGSRLIYTLSLPILVQIMHILSEAEKMTTFVSNFSETLFPQYIMDVGTVSMDVATSNVSLELE